jgi:hypothetical protein
MMSGARGWNFRMDGRPVSHGVVAMPLAAVGLDHDLRGAERPRPCPHRAISPVELCQA